MKSTILGLVLDSSVLIVTTNARDFKRIPGLQLISL